MPVTTPARALGCLVAALLLAACGGPASGKPTPDPAATALHAAAGATPASSPCRAALPGAAQALALPAGQALDFALDAVGVQIYTCTASATGAAWVFTAPEATLYDHQGRPAGTHFAGPTWEAKDGSRVVGARVAGATVDPGAIPWLLLKAVSHAGEGRMEEVGAVQRVATTGGLAPPTGCDAAAAGAVARVPYTATYCFAEPE